MSSTIEPTAAKRPPGRDVIYVLLVRCSQLIRQARRRGDDGWARFWVDEAQDLRRLLEEPR